ncbi:MAG: DUF4381 domain-containing protein [Spongiibacteraceae bacterium]
MNDVTTAVNSGEWADIHLPEEIGFFPLANGWWLLLAVCTITLLVGAIVAWRRKKQRAHRQAALLELAQIICIESDQLYAQQLNQLLRRVARQSYPQRAVVSLSGSEWQQFLLTSSTSAFTEQVLIELGAAAYQAGPPTLDRNSITEQAQRWIIKHRGARHA